MREKIEYFEAAIIWFTINYALYVPLTLFLSNKSEFGLKTSDIFLICIGIALIVLAVLNILLFAIRKRLILKGYAIIIFTIAAGIYIQSNFLNPNFPEMDGALVDWTTYRKETVLSTCVWALILIVCIFLSVKYGKKAGKMMRGIAYFFSAVQIISLIFLCIAGSTDEKATTYGFLNNEEFDVARNKNIVVMVIDTLQADSMKQYIASTTYAESEKWLEDFTFFDNAVSGGAPTALAVPLLLTGIEYDPMQEWDAYTHEIWEETDLYNDLREGGYSIRFYTEAPNVPGMPEGIADNYTVNIKNEISNYSTFVEKLYELTNFYIMPQLFKKYFWISTADITNCISQGVNCYKIDDVKFYEDLCEIKQFNTTAEKAFLVYHFNGAHAPYTMNSEGKYVDEEVTEEEQIAGVMREIKLYIQKMKEAGVYDNSTIIILGDHGRHESLNYETNPAVLIKRGGEQHCFSYDSRPIHFRNIVSLIANEALNENSEYGPSVYDINQNSDVERLHTINDSVRNRTTIDPKWKDLWYYSRCIIPLEVNDQEKYQIFDPYSINSFEYTLGDTICFNDKNEYGRQINYRIIKDHGVGIASNELSICFKWNGNEESDLVYSFICGKIYGDKQKVRVYANGNKLKTLVCAEGDIGKEIKIDIPHEYIKDSTLVLRMVFPGSVNSEDDKIVSVGFETMKLERSR